MLNKWRVFRFTVSDMTFSPSDLRMIEDCRRSEDNMADRRQLFMEMSMCSGPNVSVTYRYSVTIKKIIIINNFNAKYQLKPYLIMKLYAF